MKLLRSSIEGYSLAFLFWFCKAGFHLPLSDFDTGVDDRPL